MRSRSANVPAKSTGSRVRPLWLTAWSFNSSAPRTGCGASDASEADDAADPSSQRLARDTLVEPAAREVFVLHHQPVGERERHGEDVLHHGFGVGPGI